MSKAEEVIRIMVELTNAHARLNAEAAAQIASLLNAEQQ